MTTTTLRPATPADYERLVDIWRSAVDATHDFLSAEHRDEIQSNLAPAYFPHVTLVVAERDGEPVGFAGTAEDSLEMLFVHDDARGTGIGGTLLRHVIEEAGVLRVDVNEQNPLAVGFYEHSGFAVAGRDEVDGQGWPYPTLHLTLVNND